MSAEAATPRPPSAWLQLRPPLQSVWNVLRIMARVANIPGQRQLSSAAVWDCVLLVRPQLGKFRSQIEAFERNTKAIDWGNIDQWIHEIEEGLHQDLLILDKSHKVLGLDAVELDIFHIEDYLQRLKESPQAKHLQRLYGPNWFDAYRTCYSVFYDNLNPDACIPMGKFRRSVLQRIRSVLQDWGALQRAAHKKELESACQTWARMTPSTRATWLAQEYPELPSGPYADIYAWASQLDGHGLDKELFLRSLLDVESLSRDAVLPRLLEARATFHPWFYRSTDGGSVPFGLWCRALSQFRAQGRISFQSERGPDEDYGISFSDDATPSQDPYETSPSVALYQLQAQLHTYQFLGSCVQKLLGFLPESDQVVAPAQGDHCLSLLDRSAQLEYDSRSRTIDMEHLTSLLTASLEDARDDLWQQRIDPVLWTTRLKKTRATPSGRVPNYLRALFGRVDTFYTPSPDVDSLKEYRWFTESTMLSSSRDALTSLTSLNISLLAMLNEEVGRLEAIDWPVEKDMSATFSRLFGMLKRNHPTLRVIGLHKVMSILEREILQKDVQEKVPFAVMQALTNISILASCQKETRKHFEFVPRIDSYYTLADDREDRWSKRSRPWVSALERAFDAMGPDGLKRLEALIFRKGTSLESRHYTFWSILDKHLKPDEYLKPSRNDGDTAVVFNDILDHAPLAIVSPAHDDQPRSFPAPEVSPRTRVRRIPNPLAPPTPATTARSASPALEGPGRGTPPGSPPVTVLRAKRDTVSLFSTLFSRSEARGSVKWAAFTAAMTNLNFSVLPRFGSVFTFYPPAEMSVQQPITLHRPHHNRIEGRVLLNFASRLGRKYGWGEQTFEAE